MAISLDNIPTTIRVPLAYVEFNNENAVSGTAANPYRLLVLGQKTSAGTHPKLSPVLVTSADQAAKLFGVGSMLHAMLAAVKKANGYVEAWALAAEDNESGQKAAATVTLSGTTTKSGTLWLYIGRRVRIVQGCCGRRTFSRGDAPRFGRQRRRDASGHGAGRRKGGDADVPLGRAYRKRS